ncbi:hypothetical protein SAMN04487764_1493 [Gillisia sp. Hel1_33_143]|uniref:hypothetical protein n=1 Tax=Gillisia sp. Hel1_33_143 TaxID=1336796 RepID=UPI00087C23E1|nr:hypothetical protein [Gillisia sp. Hel1_33_143]SDS11647.1 hypothetical protein SAMN04487764_1493 [Gillisia sp. Hel1_33_143]
MKEFFRYYIITPVKDLFLYMALVLFGRNITMARSWNQLTAVQLCGVAAALEHFHKLKDCHPKEFQPAHYSKLYVALVKNLLRVNNFGKVWIALWQIPSEEYQDYVKFLLGEITRTNFIPAFRLKKETYFPPADRLQNISIKEFSFIDSLYYNWRKTQDIRYLDMLCATLYRPAGSSSKEIDPRRSFDKFFVEKDVKAIKRLRYRKKLAVAYTYEGCRNYIVKQYPHVFPAPEKGEKKIKKIQVSYTPFGKLLHFKIQFDHSKLDLVQNLNIHDFFGPYENELIEMKNKKE